MKIIEGLTLLDAYSVQPNFLVRFLVTCANKKIVSFAAN